jgi:DNA-directed RNA polymerase specialized sigma24 family protein
MQPVRQDRIFPDTRWSLIIRLRTPESRESATEVLNELCEAYWQPLYAYLRRSGQDVESAKDIVQGFLAHFLSRSGFEQVGPATGRFRHFLLGSLRNYVVSQARKDAALKRGGQVEVVPLDLEQAEEMFETLGPVALTPEAAFDRQWAQTVWSRAFQRLREEQRTRGKEQLFEALRPALTEDFREKSSDLVAATGLSSSTIAVGVHRLRRRLRQLVIDELSQTVGAHGDLEEELDYFLSMWSQ